MGDKAEKDTLYEHLGRVGKAVTSGKRLELLDLLSQGERSVDGLAAAAGMPVTNASAHLQVLRQGGLVTFRKEGTRAWYRIAGDDVARFLVTLRTVARAHVADVDRAAVAYLGSYAGVAPITRAELHERLGGDDLVVLDARPAEEYAAGHIAGARSLPAGEVDGRLDELPREAELVTYSRGPFCDLAFAAAATLAGHGFSARRLQDGFPEWRLEGLPVDGL